MLDKHKKFESDAIARFCCSDLQSKVQKNPPKPHGDRTNNNTDWEYLSVNPSIIIIMYT